jgi:hypothetical protein
MTSKFYLLAFAMLGFGAVILSAPGQAATWAVYQDDTGKCSLDYASNVFSLGKKDAEDFQRFSGPNKDTYFRVVGLANDENLSPKQIRAEYIKNRGKAVLVYERTKKDFLVLSGIRDEKIFYSKVAFCILSIHKKTSEYSMR